MRTKKIPSQLETLFNELQQEANEDSLDLTLVENQPPEFPFQSEGISASESEIDRPSIKDTQPLRLQKVVQPRISSQIIVQADEDRVQFIEPKETQPSGNGYLTKEGKESALRQSLIHKPGTQDLPSILAYSQKFGHNLLTLEFIQNQPDLQWDEEDILLLRQITEQLNLALENAILFQQTQQALADTQERARELGILNELSRKLSSELDQTAVFHSVYQATSLLMDTTNFFIALYDSVNDCLTFPYVFVDNQFVDESHPEAPFWAGAIPVEGLTGYVVRKKEPLLFTQNLMNQLKATQIGFVQIGDVAAESWLGVPMMIGDRVIGVISVQSETKPNLYNDHHTNLLSTIGNQAAIAIENARLVSQLQRRASQLQTAAEIARDTSSTLNLDSLFHRVVNLVNERFGFYHASIFVLDEEGKYAFVKESTGKAGQEMKRIKHRLAVGSKSIIGYVTQTGEPLIVNDVSASDIHRPNPLLPDTKSELAIPLKIGDDVIGALDVQSTQVNAFSPDDVTILQTLGDQIAVAIQNAQAYELSQKALHEMQHADQLKSQFLANMSHELRTPLNSIIGFSRVILKGIDGPVTETQKQDLTAIYNSGQHLLNLINDILDLSKIEAGKMDLAFDDNVHIPEIVSSIIPTVKGLIKHKPIEIIEEIQPDLPPVRADPTKIRQVLLNLLSNSAKFTDSGSITIKAHVTTTNGMDEIIVKIIDTGIGIDGEHISRLFQPFSQVDSSPTRKTGGSGLGLSISKNLIEMHGGRIGVNSQVGVGSEFYFTIPIPKPQSTTETFSPASEPQTVPVLIAIESEELLLNLYERYLSDHAVRVIKCNSLDQALSLIEQEQPFAVLIDPAIQSSSNPQHNGWSLIKTLKSNSGTVNLPVIVCSIFEEKARAIEYQAADYLPKPILEQDLVQSVMRYYPQNTDR